MHGEELKYMTKAFETNWMSTVEANIMANAVVGHNATIGECCQLKYNCTVPESCVVPDKTKVDCNGVFRDNTYFKGKNQKFIESKTKKKGVETSFF